MKGGVAELRDERTQDADWRAEGGGRVKRWFWHEKAVCVPMQGRERFLSDDC